MSDHLYLMHHAPAPRRPHEIVGSGTDRDLDEYGVYIAGLQAERVKRIIDQGFLERSGEVIISSPLRRAVQTSEIIARTIHFDLEIDDRFTAQHFGDLEGMTFSEIKQDERLIRNLWDHVEPAQRNSHQVPNGESNGAFVQRISKARANVLDATVLSPLIITHGSVIDVLISRHKQIRLDEVEGANRRFEGRVLKETDADLIPLGKNGDQFRHIPGTRHAIDSGNISLLRATVQEYIHSLKSTDTERTHLVKLLSFLQ